MSRIRALAIGAGFVMTASVGAAAVWFSASAGEPVRQAAARDLALAGAAATAEPNVVSAVERGLTAPRARASGERAAPSASRAVADPVPAPVESVVQEAIAEAPAPPVAEPEPIAVPAPTAVAVAAAPSESPSSGAVGVTALEPGETVGVFAGWNGANAAEPELPVIRANMPAVRLGGIGGGQCGGRRGGGTLVLR